MTGSPTKRALLIGIDKYQRLSGLEGCASDVQVIDGLLRSKFGFTEIVQLLDDAATRAGMLTAFDALVASTQPGDVVAFYYAGHGSRIRDREGDSPSGWDCTLVPADGTAHDGSGEGSIDITDWEIHERLIKLGQKTEHVTVIVDACHSATITRDSSEPFASKTRGVPDDPRPVSDLPPVDRMQPLTRGVHARGPSGWLPLDSKYVLIAGCREDELSGELTIPYVPPVKHGALTYYLSQAFAEASGRMTYRDVFERVNAQVVTFRNGKQHPQMEGTIDRELFGTVDIPPMQFVPVLQRSAQTSTVTLGAGAALGMTIGSRFSVYPTGTRTTEGAAALGELEIRSVGAFNSEATILSEASVDTIVQGSRAVLTTFNAGDRRLVVQLVDDAGEHSTALRTALQQSRLVRIANDNEQWALRVQLVTPRDHVEPTDVASDLGVLASSTWIATDNDGHVALPPRTAEAWSTVASNLESRARYSIAMELKNPDVASALKGKIAMELLRSTSDTTWEVATPRPEDGGQVVFANRDFVGVRITNNHTAPLYINLLDFDAACAITRIWPEGNGHEQLEPGKSFDAFTRPGSRVRFKLPDVYPFRVDTSTLPSAEAIETIRLFASTGEVSFEFLENEGVRGTGNALQLLLQTALVAPATRAVEKEPPLASFDDWTTVERSFIIRRNA